MPVSAPCPPLRRVCRERSKLLDYHVTKMCASIPLLTGGHGFEKARPYHEFSFCFFRRKWRSLAVQEVVYIISPDSIVLQLKKKLTSKQRKSHTICYLPRQSYWGEGGDMVTIYITHVQVAFHCCGGGGLHTFLCEGQSAFWHSFEQYQVFLHRVHNRLQPGFWQAEHVLSGV
jgi:hypothetical protein